MTDAEARARRIRDSLRDEKHALAVQILDRMFRTGVAFATVDERRAYRTAERRLIAAHRNLIAIVGERLAHRGHSSKAERRPLTEAGDWWGSTTTPTTAQTREKAPLPATVTALSLKRNQGNSTPNDQATTRGTR